MKAILRQVRISPKKANLVAALVRNKKVSEACDILKFTPKKAAPILKKIIESASANAENNFKQNKDELYIKEIIVTEGPTYKRSIPVSRGRVHPILKRTSHITVTTEVKEKKAKTATPSKPVKPEDNKAEGVEASEAKTVKNTKTAEKAAKKTEKKAPEKKAATKKNDDSTK